MNLPFIERQPKPNLNLASVVVFTTSFRRPSAPRDPWHLTGSNPAKGGVQLMLVTWVPNSCQPLEPACPLFWGFNPAKQGLFQSSQGSFAFQVLVTTVGRICPVYPQKKTHKTRPSLGHPKDITSQRNGTEWYAIVAAILQYFLLTPYHFPRDLVLMSIRP